MVGDIKATFSQWINHKRDNKGNRLETGQNQRNLVGVENMFLFKFNIYSNSLFNDTSVFLDPKLVHFKAKTYIFNMNEILP